MSKTKGKDDSIEITLEPEISKQLVSLLELQGKRAEDLSKEYIATAKRCVKAKKEADNKDLIEMLEAKERLCNTEAKTRSEIAEHTGALCAIIKHKKLPYRLSTMDSKLIAGVSDNIQISLASLGIESGITNISNPNSFDCYPRLKEAYRKSTNRLKASIQNLSRSDVNVIIS